MLVPACTQIICTNEETVAPEANACSENCYCQASTSLAAKTTTMTIRLKGKAQAEHVRLCTHRNLHLGPSAATEFLNPWTTQARIDCFDHFADGLRGSSNRNSTTLPVLGVEVGLSRPCFANQILQLFEIHLLRLLREFSTLHGSGSLITTWLDGVAAGTRGSCAPGSRIDLRRCIAGEHCLVRCPWASGTHRTPTIHLTVLEVCGLRVHTMMGAAAVEQGC